MKNPATKQTQSAENKKAELRRMTKEIESQVSDALVRRSTFSWALLDQVLELYPLDAELIRKVRKLQGEGLHQLRLKLFDLFAKTGQRVSDEVLCERMSELMVKHLASVPRGGRPPRTKKLAST
jgi:hypothetical protein